MKNTYQELKLTNGETVKLSLNFARLLAVKNKRPKLYEDLMRILQYKDFDIVFDSLKVLYVGYLCARVNDDEAMTEEEFMELVPFDLEKINILAGKLIQGGK